VWDGQFIVINLIEKKLLIPGSFQLAQVKAFLAAYILKRREYIICNMPAVTKGSY
jgi:hypothetical protein